MTGTPDNEVGAQIKLMREAAGLSQGQLAQMAGTNQQTVQRIEAGVTNSSRATPKLLEILRHIDLRQSSSTDDLARAYMTAHDHLSIQKDFSKSKIAINDYQAKINFVSKNKDIKIPFRLILSVETEPGIMAIHKEKDIEINLIDLIYPSDGEFAMYVPVSDMEPEFEPGDILLADSLSPPIPGVTCIFHKSEEGRSISTIKRLISSDRDTWYVKSWSPMQEFALQKSEWPVCIRVIGKFSRK